MAESLYRHLKPAYFRMKYRIPIHNPLLSKIKKEHKELFTIVQKLMRHLEALLNKPVPAGDSGLITLKGRTLIEAADVILYDRLVNSRLLEHAKASCEFVYCGKLPDRHYMRQSEINALLIEKGLKGLKVVRLKGGDPSVFGRVGEEAAAVSEHGIPYEMVPGITSGIALIPAKVSIGVSGCLDDCVYASVHDIGLLKVNGGWEFYAGGQGGQHASPGELLSVADSAEEAGELMKGLLQY